MTESGHKTIGVTKVYLPDFNKYSKYLKQIWKTRQIVNDGPFLVKLESKLIKYLGVKNLKVLANGTLGLQMAVKGLDLSGEVITTPFSYVASTTSIVWQNCQPVFVDIDPITLCIDPSKIEAKITKKTQAILAVHVYGNICNVEEIEKIAKKHKLKVIYDSAHAFGINYKGKSILNWGDISVLSFHATKIFHTGEGGAIVCNSPELAHKISYLRNFGHNGQEDFWGLGINAKTSELHAAMGLCVLPDVKFLVNTRKKLTEKFDLELGDKIVSRPVFNPNATRNYIYYPIILNSEKQLLKIRKALNAKKIFPRRYFYPSLTKLPYVKKQFCPIAENISKRVLCLPMYDSLKFSEIKKISKIIKANL